MPFHIMETKDQTYTMASSLNERQKWLKLHDWALLGTWNLEDLWILLLNCIMCPQEQYQIRIDVRYKQAESVKDRLKPWSQVIHSNHTCGGPTWMWNGTPMTFSNQLLCHSCMERHPNTIFRNDKAQRARPRPAAVVSIWRSTCTTSSDPYPAQSHMGTYSWTLSLLDFSGTNYGRP